MKNVQKGEHLQSNFQSAKETKRGSILFLILLNFCPLYGMIEGLGEFYFVLVLTFFNMMHSG